MTDWRRNRGSTATIPAAVSGLAEWLNSSHSHALRVRRYTFVAEKWINGHCAMGRMFQENTGRQFEGLGTAAVKLPCH